ncbi:MAG: L-seryl-tRNA(Sec) selenium transferase [Desulfovibrionaceae bacterium]|nr:L-seryl-tRNA(Sec) selenium transferase [Desulfovibrionaceae bacterium]
MSDRKNTLQDLFRVLPSTDRSLEALLTADDALSPRDAALRETLRAAPRVLVREAVTAYWNNVRAGIREGRLTDASALTLEARLSDLRRTAARAVSPKLRPVLNGTGVIIHTNTGRSVLPEAARRALAMAASGNSTLEFDTRTGGRGSRNALVSDLVRVLTGAEDCLVVNNNAAAVLLTLDTFCRGHEVVISRGELVEIGGSFRIPDVMESTGVRLREVGATNRTHARDYAAAICDETRAIVRVHTSNFRVVGFHTAVPTEELAAMAHERNLLLINDLGSGSLQNLSLPGLPREPTVQDALAQGSDLVLFSGDKLLGGPQAGLIAGRADLVARLRTNPLLRALRCDKLVYAALEATLRLYTEPERARAEVPTLRQFLVSEEELLKRARALRLAIGRACGKLCSCALVRDSSRAGGGAFPEAPLPTTLVAVTPSVCSVARLKLDLLETSPIIIGRIENNAFCLDPRTLEPECYPRLARVLAMVLEAARAEACGAAG